MSDEKPLVGVAMGSTSDEDVMRGCLEALRDLEVPFKVRVISAMMRGMPGRLAMSHFMLSFPFLMRPMLSLFDDGIPGYNYHYTEDMLKGRKRVRL